MGYRSILVCLASTLALGCPGEDGEQQSGTTGDSGDDLPLTGGTTMDPSSDTAVADETSGSGSSTGPAPELPDPLPPLDAAPSTVDERILPTHEVAALPELDPRVPEERTQLLDDGYGEHDYGPGEPIVARTPDGSPAPAAGPGASLLSRFVHLADTQIADDESPTRVAAIDSVFVSGAFRPQEALGCQITNAAVRTINAVHTQTPLDFVVLGGDNADSAQTNEVQWFLDILDGAPVVHCDSGADDDPTPGEGNDPKDQFAPVGLDVPWIWVTGNHDLLVQGSFATEGREADAVGSSVQPGSSTRDWSQPGGPVFMGPVVADEGRALVDGPTLLGLVAASSDGHGVTPEVADSGRATYAWDVAGTDLRFVVVDTAAPTSSSEGLITDTDVEQLIRPLLDQAEADGKLVLVASHHASTSLGDGAGLGDPPVPGALDTPDWQALVGEYPNIIAHLCGHSHVHRATYIQPMGTRGYWEVITAAVADWPHQMRMLEVHDQDNGWFTITGIALDYATEGDPLATEGRALGILDFTAGWQVDGSGVIEDRNVELWIEAP